MRELWCEISGTRSLELGGWKGNDDGEVVTGRRQTEQRLELGTEWGKELCLCSPAGKVPLLRAWSCRRWRWERPMELGEGRTLKSCSRWTRLELAPRTCLPSHADSVLLTRLRVPVSSLFTALPTALALDLEVPLQYTSNLDNIHAGATALTITIPTLSCSFDCATSVLLLPSRPVTLP